ncbi:DUF2129 domain-containing protein [Streptococcus massiliensis]|uniref:UPF0298 protein SSU98 n=1 Tax=Streptococcus massiliensis TaxID=313439 RepID=A0A380L1W2_9STRE|nr:DUF2129 domain-containing protein [Streptococcus massiliensis]SUN77355.1 UPF0298 protein SSU98 [Streptococcus massiliensis]
MQEETLQFVKEERRGLIVYLYYNRDVRKLEKLGRVLYHSKQHRYVQLYVNELHLAEIHQQLSKEKYIKEIKTCHLKDLDQNFVGNLWRDDEKDN